MVHGNPVNPTGTTPRHDAAQAAHLLAIIEQSHDLIWTATPAGQLLYMNPAARQVLGIEASADLGGLSVTSWQPRWATDLIQRDGIPTAMRNGVWVGETAFMRPDGRELPVSHMILVHRDPSGNIAYLSTIARDLSESQQAERAIREAQQLESLGVLAGGIAHKFNNLLTSILGFASLARAETGLSPFVRSCLQQVEDSSREAADVCAKMLAVAGKGRLVFAPVDLSAVVRDHSALLSIALPPGADLQLELAESLPSILADANLLGQVLVNLVTNSAEALAESGGRITLRTGTQRLSAEQLEPLWLGPSLLPGDYVHVEVSDTGHGIDEETQAHLFEPFFTTKFAGRGLGLAAVLGIVRSHRGAIAVHTTPGVGTTFRLHFPVHGATLPAPADQGVVVCLPWQARGTVLVVDDEEGVRRFVTAVLQMHGLFVRQARDGLEAVQLLQQPTTIDLVLLDLTMPRMDGQQAIEHIHKLRPGLPVVLMSGYSERDIEPRFAGLGLAGFLQKPFSHQELEGCVRTLLQTSAEGPAP